MKATPPTMEELKDLGQKMLEDARNELLAGDTFNPKIVLGDPVLGSGQLLIVVGGSLMNSPAAQLKIAERVKSLIDEKGYMHAVMVFDTYALTTSSAEEDMVVSILQHAGVRLEDVAKMGFGRLSQRLMVIVQTVSATITIGSTYKRKENGDPYDFGEAVELKNVDSGMFKFF